MSDPRGEVRQNSRYYSAWDYFTAHFPWNRFAESEFEAAVTAADAIVLEWAQGVDWQLAAKQGRVRCKTREEFAHQIRARITKGWAFFPTYSPLAGWGP